jgi:hypothetical protein
MLTDPSLTLPRGGNSRVAKDFRSFGHCLWREVTILAVLPSPNEGEGLGVRSVMQVNTFQKIS